MIQRCAFRLCPLPTAPRLPPAALRSYPSPMPRRTDHDLEDDWDEREDLDEDPDEADAGGDEGDGSSVVRCPYCRAEIYEGAEQCPKCRSYISEEEAPAGRPAWVVVVTLALLVAIVIGWL